MANGIVPNVSRFESVAPPAENRRYRHPQWIEPDEDDEVNGLQIPHFPFLERWCHEDTPPQRQNRQRGDRSNTWTISSLFNTLVCDIQKEEEEEEEKKKLHYMSREIDLLIAIKQKACVIRCNCGKLRFYLD